MEMIGDARTRILMLAAASRHPALHTVVATLIALPLAALPGMAERTVKVGSAGKIFSLTGWKVGWLVAPPELAALASRAHQFLTFASAPNLQSAVAFGMAEGDDWIAPMQARFAAARERRGAVLELLRARLAPDGVLYIEVPNIPPEMLAAVFDDR